MPRRSPFDDQLLAALRRAGGSITDKSGRAASRLYVPLGIKPATASLALARLESGGFIRRNMTGRKVYGIELVAAMPEPEPEPPPEPEPEPELAALSDPHAVAAALLAHVLDVIEGPRVAAIDARRLSDALEENARLRAYLKNNDAVSLRDQKRIEGQSIQIKNLEARIRTLEANLEAATRDVKHVVDEEVRSRLATFMQERPQLRAVKGDEE